MEKKENQIRYTMMSIKWNIESKIIIIIVFHSTPNLGVQISKLLKKN